MLSKKALGVRGAKARAVRSHKALGVRRPVAWLAPALAVLALAGCGAVKVQPTTPSASAKLASRGKVDSPLSDMDNYVGCLRQDHLPVQVLSPTKLQVGAPSGATIVFTATPGAAQADQIDGSAQGAEVIGSALVYPNQGSGPELSGIEACLAHGVQG
jgi:hypothetical protein